MTDKEKLREINRITNTPESYPSAMDKIRELSAPDYEPLYIVWDYGDERVAVDELDCDNVYKTKPGFTWPGRYDVEFWEEYVKDCKYLERVE